MGAAVHIPGYRKGHIAFRRHFHDPDRVLLVEVTLIHVRLLRESEYSGKDAAGSAAGPENIFLDKCDYTCLLVGHIFNALAGDPQQDTRFVRHLVGIRVEHLIRGPLEVQQEDTAVRESQTVILVYIVHFRASVLCRRGDPVIQRHCRRILIDLGQARCRFVVDLRIQVIPCELLHAVVDVHMGQCVLRVGRIIRLHCRTDGIQVGLVDAFVPETRRKIQIVGSVQTVRQQYMGIVIDVPAAGGHLQFQNILLVHEHSASQCQHRSDIVSVFLQSHDLRVLQRLGAVDGDDLIGDRIHRSPEGLDTDGDLSSLRQRRDGVAHLADIHLMVIAVETVEVDPALPHIDQRERGGCHLCRRIRGELVDHPAGDHDSQHIDRNERGYAYDYVPKCSELLAQDVEVLSKPLDRDDQEVIIGGVFVVPGSGPVCVHQILVRIIIHPVGKQFELGSLVGIPRSELHDDAGIAALHRFHQCVVDHAIVPVFIVHAVDPVIVITAVRARRQRDGAVGHMCREDLLVRTAQIIVIRDGDAGTVFLGACEYRVPPGDVHMVIVAVDPDDIPCMVAAGPDRTGHVGAEITHPVADILKCFRISRTHRLMIEQSALHALIVRRLGIVDHRIDQVFINRLDPSVVGPALIGLRDADIRCLLQASPGHLPLIFRNRRLDLITGNLSRDRIRLHFGTRSDPEEFRMIRQNRIISSPEILHRNLGIDLRTVFSCREARIQLPVDLIVLRRKIVEIIFLNSAVVPLGIPLPVIWILLQPGPHCHLLHERTRQQGKCSTRDQSDCK